jgi:hypothetical protein
MMLRMVRLAAAMVGTMLTIQATRAGQDGLVPDTEVHGPVLQIDWPDIQVGVGSYEEGPTGLTIIRFMHRAGVVVDSRGGAPGTVNTDSLRLGYDGSRTRDSEVARGMTSLMPLVPSSMISAADG